MTLKNTKTVLFAGLIVAMILPFSGMQFVQAEKQTKETLPEYNPSMVNYIEKLISQLGENIDKRTVGDKTIEINTITTQINNNEYSVKSIVMLNGELQSDEVFKIIVPGDGNYNLINTNIGLNSSYTSTELITPYGWGSSNDSGASIRLYDGEFGTPNTLNLYDSYSACWSFNQAVMDVNISVPTVDVTWEASPYYLDDCFNPHLFEHAIVTHGSQTYEFSGQTERQGSHAFVNIIGEDGWYSVSINFLYGDW